MVKKLMLAFILSLFLLTGCIPYIGYKHFTLARENPQLDKVNLRVDGLYYQINKSTYPEYPNSYYLTMFILYNNGTYLNLGGDQYFGNKDSTILSNLIDFEEYKERKKSNLGGWGAYIIENDTIRIQSFNLEPGWRPYRLFEKKGRIANDSTIIFFSHAYAVRSHWLNFFEKKKWEGFESIYHFYPINKKPDSINLFTTNKRIARRLDRLEEKRKKKKNKSRQ